MDNQAIKNEFDVYLEGIGIDLQDEQRVYVPVTADVAVQYGFQPPTDGIFIVHTNLNGSVMLGADGEPFVELRHADGQLPAPGRRYSMRPGSGTHLFFPRRLKEFLDSTDFCLITEGAKKASVVSCLGFPCIGLIGWSAWRTTGTDDLHYDFRQIQLENRNLFLIPDFDGAFNADIHREVQKLALALHGAGAREVRLVKLPPVSGEKMGIDDFLVMIREETANV